jgi:hypothetical protein
MLDMAKCDMTRQLLSVNGRFANQQLRKAPSAEAEKKPKEAKKPRKPRKPCHRMGHVLYSSELRSGTQPQGWGYVSDPR